MTAKTEAKRKYQDTPGGLFIKGNPGKPVGSKHMTTKIMEAITRVSDKTGTSDDVQIVKTLVEKAKAGDMRGIELILNYVDGRPKSAEGELGSATNPIQHSVAYRLIRPGDSVVIEQPQISSSINE